MVRLGQWQQWQQQQQRRQQQPHQWERYKRAVRWRGYLHLQLLATVGRPLQRAAAEGPAAEWRQQRQQLVSQWQQLQLLPLLLQRCWHLGTEMLQGLPLPLLALALPLGAEAVGC